jgi:hypothetical protein
VPNETAPTAVDSRSYEVLFGDADGTKHHLQRVKVLRITDLPGHTLPAIPLGSDSKSVKGRSFGILNHIGKFDVYFRARYPKPKIR